MQRKAVSFSANLLLIELALQSFTPECLLLSDIDAEGPLLDINDVAVPEKLSFKLPRKEEPSTKGVCICVLVLVPLSAWLAE